MKTRDTAVQAIMVLTKAGANDSAIVNDLSGED